MTTRTSSPLKPVPAHRCNPLWYERWERERETQSHKKGFPFPIFSMSADIFGLMWRKCDKQWVCVVACMDMNGQMHTPTFNHLLPSWCICNSGLKINPAQTWTSCRLNPTTWMILILVTTVLGPMPEFVCSIEFRKLSTRDVTVRKLYHRLISENKAQYM